MRDKAICVLCQKININGNNLKKIVLLITLLMSSLNASFSGIIIDKTTHKTVPYVIISDSIHTIKSDRNGSFSIKSKEKIYHVKAYGYKPLSFTSENNSSEISVEPITVKALYLTYWGASNNSRTLKNMLKIVNSTEINAIVMDVKNEYGSTSYFTSFKQANSYGAHKTRTNRNIQKFMQMMKEHNIYTIARIVVFKDELQASNNPEYALKKDATGKIWRNADKMAWVDPFDKRGHKYSVRMAEEAAKVGFDEINFDYIRFPAKTGLCFSKKNNQKNRVKAIGDFIDMAQNKLRKYGVFISVNTYGNICWSKDDNGIGQTVAQLAKHADYLAPMLYPSGFSSGSFHFKYPADHPYSVVRRSISNIKDKIDTKRVRPWLQYFRDYKRKRRHYKKFEVQEQIRAANDTKTSGWMMWSPSSKYHENYFIH